MPVNPGDRFRIVDKHGAVVFMKIYDIPTLPDISEVRRAIEQVS